jgi:hypothetical protein
MYSVTFRRVAGLACSFGFLSMFTGRVFAADTSPAVAGPHAAITHVPVNPTRAQMETLPQQLLRIPPPAASAPATQMRAGLKRLLKPRLLSPARIARTPLTRAVLCRDQDVPTALALISARSGSGPRKRFARSHGRKRIDQPRRSRISSLRYAYRKMPCSTGARQASEFTGGKGGTRTLGAALEINKLLMENGAESPSIPQRPRICR